MIKRLNISQLKTKSRLKHLTRESYYNSDSRLPNTVYTMGNYGYFLTTEKINHGQNSGWTIRKVHLKNGNVTLVSRFAEYTTRYFAQNALFDLLTRPEDRNVSTPRGTVSGFDCAPTSRV